MGLLPELCADGRRVLAPDRPPDYTQGGVARALVGVSITFISMKPALDMFMTPVIGVVCFAIILVSWFGGVKYGKIPAGLAAIAAGALIALGPVLLSPRFPTRSDHGFHGFMDGCLKWIEAFSTFRR